jgi:Na+/proline symporter
MPEPGSLHAADWAIIALYMMVTLGVGVYFTRRAGSNLESYFVSGRSLPWFLAGISMAATSFASDTPLWVTSLIREYGVYYLWQLWAPGIGFALGTVLFARMWRRMRLLTDMEFLELRYAGPAAAGLRFWLAFSSAMIVCPLTIGWVTKGMETIMREATGLPPEFQGWTTAAVVLIALVSCTLAGLWGVVYTDLVQFILAMIGTVSLAVISVSEVGGLDMLLTELRNLGPEHENVLRIAPSIGSGAGQMTVWNALGYFGLFWIASALSGGFQAQRILASRDPRHATFATLLFTYLNYALVCWPWIIVGLCSLILIPNLGEGVSDDAAYPRMIVHLLPVGLRGLLVAALLAAFMSTISTMFNWGSSYLVNDVYKRFIVREGSDRHYVAVGRAMTLYLAVAGGLISLAAEDIQQLLTIFYVVGVSMALVAVMRWFWWRQTAAGELAAMLSIWIVAPLMLFAEVFDGPARALLGVTGDLSSDPDLLGARMVFTSMIAVVVDVVVSLIDRQTPEHQLREFVRKVRPFYVCWNRIIDRMEGDYEPGETLGRTLTSWLLVVVSIYTLMVGLGKLLLGEPVLGIVCLAGFAVSLWLTVQRINRDFRDAVPEESAD